MVGEGPVPAAFRARTRHTYEDDAERPVTNASPPLILLFASTTGVQGCVTQGGNDVRLLGDAARAVSKMKSWIGRPMTRGTFHESNTLESDNSKGVFNDNTASGEEEPSIVVALTASDHRPTPHTPTARTRARYVVEDCKFCAMVIREIPKVEAELNGEEERAGTLIQVGSELLKDDDVVRT